MMRKGIVWSLLVLSTLGGIVSVYSLLFAVWMTAHPRYDSHAWRVRFYERLAITVLDALIWFGSVVWLFRQAEEADKKRTQE